MDHSHHDHSQHMDHMNHDHGSMNSDHGAASSHDASASALPSHMCHMMMSMSFHFGVNETILFDFWKTSSVYGLIGSMIGICIMAALYEGLKYYREHLFWNSYNSLQYRSVQMPVDKNSTDRVVQPSMFSKMHTFQTFLHVIQMVISYFLMLIFMTYNVYLCIAVVIGAGIGYFLFGWKKSVIVDVTEHCH